MRRREREWERGEEQEEGGREDLRPIRKTWLVCTIIRNDASREVRRVDGSSQASCARPSGRDWQEVEVLVRPIHEGKKSSTKKQREGEKRSGRVREGEKRRGAGEERNKITVWRISRVGTDVIILHCHSGMNVCLQKEIKIRWEQEETRRDSKDARENKMEGVPLWERCCWRRWCWSSPDQRRNTLRRDTSFRGLAWRGCWWWSCMRRDLSVRCKTITKKKRKRGG